MLGNAEIPRIRNEQSGCVEPYPRAQAGGLANTWPFCARKPGPGALTFRIARHFGAIRTGIDDLAAQVGNVLADVFGTELVCRTVEILRRLHADVDRPWLRAPVAAQPHPKTDTI